MGPSLGSQAGFAVPYDLKLPLTTPRGLKDPAKAAQQLDAAGAKVMDLYGSPPDPWRDMDQSDQLGSLAKKELRTAWLTRADVEASLESRERF
jgi:hypothetical protein